MDSYYTLVVPCELIDFHITPDMIIWLSENVGDDDWSYSAHLNGYNSFVYELQFRTKEDIMGFKLRWL